MEYFGREMGHTVLQVTELPLPIRTSYIKSVTWFSENFVSALWLSLSSVTFSVLMYTDIKTSLFHQ